jgi:hypothetical protein
LPASNHPDLFIHKLAFQICGNLGELRQGGLEVLDDLRGCDVDLLPVAQT